MIDNSLSPASSQPSSPTTNPPVMEPTNLTDRVTREWIAAISASIRDHVQQSNSHALSQSNSLLTASRPLSRSRQALNPETLGDDDDWYSDDEEEDDFLSTFGVDRMDQSTYLTNTQPVRSRLSSTPVIATRNIQLTNQANDQQTINQIINAPGVSLSVDSNDATRCLIDPSFYQLMEQLPVINPSVSIDNTFNQSINRSVSQICTKDDLDDDDFYDQCTCQCDQCLIFPPVSQTHNQSNNQTYNQSNNQSNSQVIFPSSQTLTRSNSSSTSQTFNQSINRSLHVIDELSEPSSSASDGSVSPSGNESNSSSSDQSGSPSVHLANSPSIGQTTNEQTSQSDSELSPQQVITPFSSASSMHRELSRTVDEQNNPLSTLHEQPVCQLTNSPFAHRARSCPDRSPSQSPHPSNNQTHYPSSNHSINQSTQHSLHPSIDLSSIHQPLNHSIDLFGLSFSAPDDSELAFASDSYVDIFDQLNNQAGQSPDHSIDQSLNQAAKRLIRNRRYRRSKRSTPQSYHQSARDDLFIKVSDWETASINQAINQPVDEHLGSDADDESIDQAINRLIPTAEVLLCIANM